MKESIMPCPKCGTDVKCLYQPGMRVTKYSRAASNKKAMNYTKPERFIPMQACPKCGNTAITNDNSMLASKAAERAKAAGLPTRL